MKAIPEAEKQQKINKVLTQMRDGNSLRQAAEMAGVARQTFLDWVHKDEERGLHFSQEVDDI